MLGNPGAEIAGLVVKDRGLPRGAAVEFLDGNVGQSGLSLPNLVSMSDFVCVSMGRGQVVKATGFDPVIPGSSPGAPANSVYYIFQSLRKIRRAKRWPFGR